MNKMEAITHAARLVLAFVIGWATGSLVLWVLV